MFPRLLAAWGLFALLVVMLAFAVVMCVGFWHLILRLTTGH